MLTRAINMYVLSDPQGNTFQVHQRNIRKHSKIKALNIKKHYYLHILFKTQKKKNFVWTKGIAKIRFKSKDSDSNKHYQNKHVVCVLAKHILYAPKENYEKNLKSKIKKHYQYKHVV